MGTMTLGFSDLTGSEVQGVGILPRKRMSQIDGCAAPKFQSGANSAHGGGSIGEANVIAHRRLALGS